jgi:hypothetical protein
MRTAVRGRAVQGRSTIQFNHFTLAIFISCAVSLTSFAQVDPCLANLPQPVPKLHRVVQLVNCSGDTLLGAANAAGQSSNSLVSVLPREGTWVMAPIGSPNNANVLTIDIPAEWENTIGEGKTGPNFWARTGCRYEIATNKAQCETGGAGGVYDISKAKLGPPGATTIAEWSFYEGPPYHYDHFDISAVNGVNLNMDIQAVGGSPLDPANAQNVFWWNLNAPLSVHGADLRAPLNCPAAFQLQRSDLTSGVYAFVIVGDNGRPVGGDATVACFSNCGKYKFPLEPAQNCNPNTDSRCYRWKTFCAGDPTQYGKKCSTDADCSVNGSCWVNPGSPIDHTCQLRGFNFMPNCDPKVCTFPYGYINPYTHQPDYSTQPPFGQCLQVLLRDPSLFRNPLAFDLSCMGEDRVHKVFPHAYSWPNDPQTYQHDAPLYRIIFAPGGTKVPITDSVAQLPLCGSLPGNYNYNQFKNLCSIDIQNGAVFGIARRNNAPWSCNLGTGSGNDGVVCRWKAP